MTEVNTQSDEELALAVKAGDHAAFNVLVQRCEGRAFAVAYRMTSNREDARDVAQDALIKAYRKIDKWEPTSGFLPWVLRITANQAIDFLRRRKRRPISSLEDESVARWAEAHASPGAADTATSVRNREIDERVQIALECLSPMQRSVFVMRHYEGFSLAEIADALGCTSGSVKVHLFRALRKLRKELDDLRD